MDANSNDPLEQALIRLGGTVERNIDRASRSAAQLDRTLISLSAGALLLSSTFVPIFAPQKQWLPLLFLAWLSFLATMILVIFAMRSAQIATETAIRNASEALRQLEENPTVAREAIKVLGLEQPIVKKIVRRDKRTEHLNNWAPGAFIAGAVCLVLFAGYNLWRTPAAHSEKPAGKIGVIVWKLDEGTPCPSQSVPMNCRHGQHKLPFLHS